MQVDNVVLATAADERHPRKQGLKPLAPVASLRDVAGADERHPRKQGLKLLPRGSILDMESEPMSVIQENKD